jgi:hypothetical protein
VFFSPPPTALAPLRFQGKQPVRLQPGQTQKDVQTLISRARQLHKAAENQSAPTKQAQLNNLSRNLVTYALQLQNLILKRDSQARRRAAMDIASTSLGEYHRSQQLINEDNIWGAIEAIASAISLQQAALTMDRRKK